MPTRRGRPIGLSEALARRSGQTGNGGAPPISTHLFEQGAKGPADSSPLVRTVYPPWVNKLPMSQDFNQNDFATVLAAGIGAVVIPVSFAIPQSFVGWLQIVGIYVQSPTALTDITYTFRINQGPIPGYDNIDLPPGTLNIFVQNFSDVQVRIPSGAMIDLVVTNNSAAGPWTVGGKIAGYYHPESEEKRIYGAL